MIIDRFKLFYLKKKNVPKNMQIFCKDKKLSVMTQNSHKTPPPPHTLHPSPTTQNLMNTKI